MDNLPPGADDLPDEAELSGPVRDAIEQICRDQPSDAMLARVLQRARQIAAASSGVPSLLSSENPSPDKSFINKSPADNSPPDTASRHNDLPVPRRHRMFTFAVRALGAATAATALIGAWLYNQVSSTAAADLGAVLTRTSAADSLELKVTRDGKTGNVWVRGQKLRRDLPGGDYEIARDGKAWLVDEKANRASAQPASFFSAEAGKLDLLALLDLPAGLLGGKQQQLLAALPAEHTALDGRQLIIYRWQTSGPDGTLRIDATVDAKTQLLESIESLRVRGERIEPICKLAVIARDKPVNEDLFVVGDTLTEDGRIGKVIDAQGLVTMRPVMHDRASPLAEQMPIRLGDLLQTDPRGANAVSIRLAGQTELVIGPGSTIELSTPKQLRLSEGEIKIKAEGKSPISLIGPDGKQIAVTGTQTYRADGRKLVKLDNPPRWLLSYEGKVVGDSIGSLLAKIDGRNVPLTVGYHQVAVDIRDQIARTTIEESFVNHTNTQLEGTFFFPLPQDASIAGFGMWIGDKLVEADVVEKQRAREIYETILRERRDPGLLEWAGGNIFKARVFPIPANAEKRITITYTQVLPLRGNSFRYQYALQSDLLKQHPLRQLNIDVKINSTQGLKAVSSPTHLTRNALTAHSAHVEFSAKEYTPTSDFEAVVELQGQQPEVVLIPHRRGDDGYFMLQLMPPNSPLLPEEGQLQRELLPNGEPIDLVLLADTSASIDAPSRERQAELIAALLGALTPKDKFNLGTCDVDCQWVFAKAATADAKNIEMARQKLAARASLGWTDLDKAMQSALAQCGPKTHVVYIGDGITTTGDADPVAFVKRLRRMVEEHTHHAPRDAGAPEVPHAEREEYGTFHSVALSSSFEPTAMKAVAAIGGGSFLQISGSRGPAAVAMDLLGEITQPALRDMRIEFRGLRTARVYPDPLPNLAVGTQQIILGRYDPQGKEQSGEVIVHGTLDGKPVKYTSQVSLKGAEEGNSFIPRLWARMYLDTLLEQGSSQAIKDEVTALSEEFHIITPYTSLLVLETDADRERFGVKRRFQMRDGEKFFAQGRENANWELVQDQMKRAGTWRLGLRHQVLQQFSLLGRDVPAIQATPYATRGWGRSGGGAGFGGFGPDSYSSPIRAGSSLGLTGLNSFAGDAVEEHSRRLDDSWNFQGANRAGMDDYFADASAAAGVSGGDMFFNSSLAPMNSPVAGEGDRKVIWEEEEDTESLSASRERGESNNRWDVDGNKMELGVNPVSTEVVDGLDVLVLRGSKKDIAELMDEVSQIESDQQAADMPRSSSPLGYHGFAVNGKPSRLLGWAGGLLTTNQPWGPGGVDYSWFNNLFVTVPPPPVKPKEPKQPWPAEARQIARSLLRSEQLTGVKDGLQIEIQTESRDPRWDTLTGRAETKAIVSPIGWLTVSSGDSSQTYVSWANAKERGSLAGAMLLGRVRTSRPADLRQPPLDLGTGTLSPLDLAYVGYSVKQNLEGEHETMLVLKHPNLPRDEIRILVDTAMNVVLKTENIALPSPGSRLREDGRGAGGEGKVTSATTFSDFVQVAGTWYAGRIETTDGNGRRTSLVTQKFSTLAAGDFDRQWKQDLAIRERAQLLREPLPKLADAKQAVAGGKATFEDQIVMLLHFQATPQWDRVLEYLADAEKRSGKPGMRWVRMSVLSIARHAEEAKKQVLDEAQSLAKLAKSQSSGNELALADWLLNHANLALEANEQLRLLDALRPVYERQPAYLMTMKRWTESRCNSFEQAGQSQQVLKLRKQLAAGYPHDYGLQQAYARALANAGNYPAAYAWLDGVLVPASKWLPNEEESLVGTYSELLQQQGRFDDLVEYLSGWINRNPPSQNIYAQYLSALVLSDHAKRADGRVARWIHDAQEAVRTYGHDSSSDSRAGSPNYGLPADVSARLGAAVSQALGQGYNLYTNRIDPQWFKPLGDAAITFARYPATASVADQIMNYWLFQQTDECRRVRKTALQILLDEIGKLPADQLQRLMNWISANDPAVENEAWQKIAAGLRGRWDAEPDWQVKNQLGGMLAGVLQGHIGVEPWLAFLRTQVKGSPEEQRAGHARQLFDALLGQPWKPAYEDEAFGLLAELPDAETASQRLAFEVAALCQMTDRMVQARFQDRMKAVEHPEKLTRIELRAKQTENLRVAREGYVDRLKKEMGVRQGPLLPWMNIERLYLDVQLGRNLDKVAEECFELLGTRRSFLPERTDEPAPVDQRQASHAASGTLVPLGKRDLHDDTDTGQQYLANLMQNRCLTTLMNLAARKNAKPGLVDRVLAYLDAAEKANPEDTRWKVLQYEILVALDRPKELAKRLQAWIVADDADNGWRLILGYLEAESGHIPAAIKLFEAVRAADELRGADYRTLADWYMAVNRRADYDLARVETFKAIDEWRLNQWLWSTLQPWQRYNDQQPPPRELDVEVLYALTALFEKASQPQIYLNQVQQFYAATRDFRLLAGLADAVIGQTAERVYPFIESMSGVLGEVRDEATADSIVERIATTGRRAKTDVDRRALDLLELLVQRRAAEIQNQPGPHVQKALAAMRRAWKRQWSQGEPRLIADLLASLGHISQQPLADEQVSELESLYRDAARGTADRLKIGTALARTYWDYSRTDRAIDLLIESLDEYQAACEGVLPASANDALGTLIGYLEDRTQHARGEKILQEQLKHPVNQQQIYWLVQRLYQLYDSAIAKDGDVSLGHGVELYRAVEKKLSHDLDTPDQNHRYNLVTRLNAIYRTANNKQLPSTSGRGAKGEGIKLPSTSGRGAGGEGGFQSVADDLRRFAFHRLPEVLKRQTNNYTQMVSDTANALHDIAGPRYGLTFLVERIDAEPEWFRLNNQDGWSQFGWTLAQWRRNEVLDSDEVQKPLLAIVLKELRRDLQSRQQHNRVIFNKHNNNYWSEKETDFARTADQVWAENNQSSAECQYIAEYLYDELDHYDRAIEILLDAHRREVLDEGGQSRLVDYLRRQNRFAETIPILEPLVVRQKDNLQYRIWLMNAYFKTGNGNQLARLFKETQDYFHKDNRWNEQSMVMLGRSCLENEIYRNAADYLAEAIDIHQRTAPRRGIGDGTLSGYYGDQARAFAGLKQTPEAVDAAATAVVSWGRDVNNRNNALEALRAVLRAAPDLDAYVVQLDKHAAEVHEENPILRQAIGQVYREKKRFDKAIAQLLIAAEVQPNDAETYKTLLECYDQVNDQQGAVEQILAWRQLAPRDIKLYEDLGKRLEKLGQAAEVERAYTSIVEALPSEAESHQLLAEVRQRQDRWADAADQWRQVARIRSLEPNGLLGLTEALIHERRFAEAAELLSQLKQTSWPARFQNWPMNLPGKISDLEQKLRQAKSK